MYIKWYIIGWFSLCGIFCALCGIIRRAVFPNIMWYIRTEAPHIGESFSEMSLTLGGELDIELLTSIHLCILITGIQIFQKLTCSILEGSNR